MTDFSYAPPTFETVDRKKVVFVDFIDAHYSLVFDAAAHQAHASSTITFETTSQGFAALCLKQPLISASLDGGPVTFDDPDSNDPSISFKILSKSISAGTHVLNVRSRISQPVVEKVQPVIWSPRARRLECKFAMSDMLPNAALLGGYLPSNFEFDHVKMRFSVTLTNSAINHTVFANGDVTKDGSGQWEIKYPDIFTTSCPWFHFGPSDLYESEEGVFVSSNKREVPVSVYTRARWLKRGVDLGVFGSRREESYAHDS